MKKQLLTLLTCVTFVMTGWTQDQLTYTTSPASISTLAPGTVVTVNYTYTLTPANAKAYIYSAIYNTSPWTALDEFDPSADPQLPAGTNVTGTFNLTVPANTIPTSSLTAGAYEFRIEFKDAGNGWAEVQPAIVVGVTVSPTAGVDDVQHKLNKLSVHPNPARHSFQITNFSKLKNPSIIIFDMLGRVKYSASNSISTIDISNFANGLYVLNINSDGLSETIQFVKF